MVRTKGAAGVDVSGVVRIGVVAAAVVLMSVAAVVAEDAVVAGTHDTAVTGT